MIKPFRIRPSPADQVSAAVDSCHARPLIGYLRLDARFRPGQAGVEVPGGVALTSAARGGLAWLSHGVRLVGHRDEEWLKRGLTSSR